ncbi:hypothetical protein C8R47DRAFT_567686 [Mycena vitilis]|nr:hypothetical protein C8R47DRAFT_567686 [Mycena vitilis]
MGQYWKIVDLDKRHTSGGGCKLGEFFFDGTSAESLESRLWPPKIVSDVEAAIPRLIPGGRYGPDDTPDDTHGPALYFPKTAPRPSLDAAVLVNLPAEIAHEIFSYLSDIYDLLCLSAACQVLWEIGREHVYRHISAIVARYSWAGDRIICVGDCLASDDIPEALLTASERAELLYCEPEERDHEDEEDEENSERALYRTLYGYPFQEAARRLNRGPLIQFGIFERFGQWASIRSSRDMHVIMDLFNGQKFILQPPKVIRILRNLSRRQYVRESELVDLTVRCPGVGLGNIVLSRICLSSDDSIAMRYDGGIHRGAWAGDRLDIVAAEWLTELGEDPSWTDVTKEAVEEMENICEADYYRFWFPHLFH